MPLPAQRRSTLLAAVLAAALILTSCAVSDDTTAAPSTPTVRSTTQPAPEPTEPPATVTSEETAPATTLPAAPSTTEATETTDCHPAYTTCIPHLVGDALNCAHLRADKKPVIVKQIGTDPYLLDGDRDGRGCEDSAPTGDASGSTSDCHPAYETCIPNLDGDAMDCADLPDSKKPVIVKEIGTDPYLLDGDRDGRGCEGDTSSAQQSQSAGSDAADSERTTSRCHPAYVTCIPNRPGDALNCADLTSAQKPVRLKQRGVDPYRLDGDGDGVGCESSTGSSSTQRQTDRSTRGTCTHDGRGHAFLGYNPGTHTHPTSHTHKTGKCAGV